MNRYEKSTSRLSMRSDSSFVSDAGGRKSLMGANVVVQMDLKSTYVIELGTRWNRIGIAGEHRPRTGVSTHLWNAVDEKTHHYLENDCCERGKKYLVKSMVEKLMQKMLPLRDIRLFFIEDLMMPVEHKKLLVDTIYQSFPVKTIAFLPSPFATMVSCPGVTTCLVVRIGYKESTCLPICDNFVYFKGYESSNVSATYLMDQIADYFDVCGQVKDSQGTLSKLEPSDLEEFESKKVAEELAVNWCFVSTKPRGQMLQNWSYENKEDHFEFVTGGEFPLNGKKLLVSGFIREAAAECLFSSEKMTDVLSITELIYKSIRNCPVDYRKRLISNIVLVGGLSNMKRIKPRLLLELKELLETEEGGRLAYLKEDADYVGKVDHIKKYSKYFEKLELSGKDPQIIEGLKSKKNYTPNTWFGGSVYAELNRKEDKYYTKEQWLAGEKVFDWTNVKIEIPTVENIKVYEQERVLAVRLNDSESVSVA